MKKIMFVLGAMIAAMSASAAYVDWQYSVSEPKTGGSDWSSGYTAYLVTSANWDTIKDNVTASGLSGAALDSSGFSLASSTKKDNIYSTGAHQVEASSGNYYVILATADGYSVAVNNASVTAYADASSGGTGLTPGVTISTPTAGSGIAFTAFGGGSPDPGGDGPEPTSGLLLLVGAGILGLRRKRA